MAVVDPRLAGKPVPSISRDAMERGYVARANAKGSNLAFLDQRLPAYEREIINMVGMGVTENADAAAACEGRRRRLFGDLYPRAQRQRCGAAPARDRRSVHSDQGPLAGVLAGRRR